LGPPLSLVGRKSQGTLRVVVFHATKIHLGTHFKRNFSGFGRSTLLVPVDTVDTTGHSFHWTLI